MDSIEQERQEEHERNFTIAINEEMQSNELPREIKFESFIGFCNEFYEMIETYNDLVNHAYDDLDLSCVLKAKHIYQQLENAEKFCIKAKCYSCKDLYLGD